MRTFFAITIGCLVMLIAFSVPWSLFVIRHHDYAGDSRPEQILVTVVLLGFSSLPISLVLALAVIWPLNFIAQPAVRKKAQVIGWFSVAFLTYLLLVLLNNPGLGIAAFFCAAFAAVAGMLGFFAVHRKKDLSHETDA
jgi:multisubunit Na+/H+ antiporter MnhB subunit